MLPAPNLDVDLQYCFEANWKNFSLSELQQATDNFSPGNAFYMYSGFFFIIAPTIVVEPHCDA